MIGIYGFLRNENGKHSDEEDCMDRWTQIVFQYILPDDEAREDIQRKVGCDDIDEVLPTVIRKRRGSER